MGKVYTSFQTKTKTLPDAAAHTYIAYIREYPRPACRGPNISSQITLLSTTGAGSPFGKLLERFVRWQPVVNRVSIYQVFLPSRRHVIWRDSVSTGVKCQGSETVSGSFSAEVFLFVAPYWWATRIGRNSCLRLQPCSVLGPFDVVFDVLES